ncbi:hypothetical protein [Streptomyces sp. CA-106131]|uniref:hypothetical protein n=1 Tax=Streptomyces sp. CA-106131 TaxID=3240045 RepID=UPI003D924426
MSWLRLWEYVFALPMESMTKAAMRGDSGYRRWTETEYLLNRQLDILTLSMQILWAANGVSGKPPKGPIMRDPDLRTAEQIEAEALRSQRLERFVEATRPGAGDSEYLRRLQESRDAGKDAPAPAQSFGNGPIKVNPQQLSPSEMDQLLAFRVIRDQAQQIAKNDKAGQKPQE